MLILYHLRKWYDAFTEAGCQPRKSGVGDMILAVTDSCIAAQNCVTAAESMGIGSCYIGDVWANAFCKGKYNSDFSVEMTRSVM